MPTIIRQDGFLIMIMLNDHRPPHVHAFKGNGRARITLGNSQERPHILEAYGMKDADAKKSIVNSYRKSGKFNKSLREIS